MMPRRSPRSTSRRRTLLSLCSRFVSSPNGSRTACHGPCRRLTSRLTPPRSDCPLHQKAKPAPKAAPSVAESSAPATPAPSTPASAAAAAPVAAAASTDASMSEPAAEGALTAPAADAPAAAGVSSNASFRPSLISLLLACRHQPHADHATLLPEHSCRRCPPVGDLQHGRDGL